MPDHQEVVSPAQARNVVAFDGAQVMVPAGALKGPVPIGISDLLGAQVPKLDAGMTNVTGKPRGGFRFTPHPMTFAGNVELTLPYDSKLLPTGMSGQDVYSYFYDDAALCWRPLQRKSVDEKNHTVTSLTNHFTDFINTTVTAPDSPDNVSFNPNQIKGISSADPAAGITLLGAPGANSQGTNNLSYPIAVPAGRLGVQPTLAISYDSSIGNGWLGVGWDLALPQITIDTRFGVPRYDAGRETESYLLNGAQLTPLADRNAPVARSTGDKVFHTRVESRFARIVRHGAGPSTYTWEVTDKAGTHFFYGALAEASGPEADQTLSGGDNAGSGVFVWPLREMRDAHGNFVRFTYVKQADPGVPGGQDGVDLYPQTITYTGSGSDVGRYKVKFVRDRDLGEPLRTDKQIDARGGFKRVTADRLRHVDVSFTDNPATGHELLVRRYVLSYTTGAFGKTLLTSIGQTDNAGAVVGTNAFGYFDDVRNGGSYHGFADGTDWSVPGDSLADAKLNSFLTGSGGASVISANSTSTVGGHLFIGGGTGSPVLKSDKIGPKVGASSSSGESLVALVDVDGDGLPDKVFRTGDALSGFSFWYRKNLSRPGGQPAFSPDKKQLNLPSIGHGSSNSWVWGIEGYTSSVAAQLDRVQVSSTQNRYFADVNYDGVVDLVDGSGVWFGRLGADGTPGYGFNDSASTAAPITSRPVDTSVLGNLAQAPAQLVDANPPADSVRRWIAPFDGDVAVNAPVRLSAATQSQRAASRTADGVRVAIQLNGTELGSVDVAATDDASHFVVPSTRSIAVHQGDRLYFRVGAKNDGSLDQVDWDPLIGYLNLDSQNTVDENGLPTRDFHQATDFTLGGRATQVIAPLTGTLHLSGAVVKAHATTDDITVMVTRDGASVFSQTIAATASGSTVVSADVAVTQGQVLTWRLAVDSPVDLGSLSWVPRADYTAADGLDRVVDADGNPLVGVFPPYDVDMYPDDGGLTGPRAPFTTGTQDGDYSVQPTLSFAPPTDAKPSGQVVFTVKRRNQLLGKRVIQVADGVVSSVSPIVVHEVFGPSNPGEDPAPDELFFDYSTRDPGLRSFVPSSGVKVTFDPADPETAPSMVDTGAPFRTPVIEDGFPQPYRGWSVIAYNGSGSRETAPIVESDLVIDHNYADQFPDSVDPQGQKDTFNADPHVEVPKAFPLAPSPKDGRWSGGQDLWLGAGGASTSRLGTDSVALPSGSDFAGAIAVSRVSSSTQTSLTGSVSIAGGSGATGDSVGQVDFLDLNGDGFPDVVSGGGIQYSDPDGGLGSKHGTLPDGAVRSSSTSAGNVGISASAGDSAGNQGSPAQTTPEGSGSAAPTGDADANTAHGGNSQQSFGVAGNADIGFSDSDSQFDLVDVNGDALPDRVYADGGVRLNFGYSFGDKEQWSSPTPTSPSGAPLNDGGGTTTNGGLNLGFNTEKYSFAGGVSFSQEHNGTAATLADVNGDGLPDRVFDGNPIMVGFNTGNGFASPVEFGGGLSKKDPRGSGIASDQNSSVGGGAYATFGFCFLGLCVVFNPGVDASVGVSRSVQALRDVNGDGYADQVVSTDDDTLTVAANTTGRTNLLKSVTLPLGGQMDFDYVRDGNTAQLPQSRFVLSRVSVDDKRPGDGADVQATTYSYSGGVYDRAEREFDGYATVVARQVDAGNNDAVLRTVTDTFRTDGPYTRGLLTKAVTADGAGHPFLETDNTYTLHNVDTNSDDGDPHSSAATIFPQLTRTDTKWFEGQSTPGKTTFTTTSYDAVGNVIESFEAGEPGSGDDVDTTVSYTATDAACQATGIIGVPDVIDVTGGGVLVRHRDSTVDCSTGNVTQVRQPLLGDQVAVRDLEYFPNGNLKKVTDPTNLHGDRYFESYGYDSTIATYVVSIDDAYGLHSSSVYEFRGLLLSSTDVNNQRISYTYDALGRQVTVVGPYEQGSSNATIRFEYHPEASVPYAITKHVDRQANGTVLANTIDTINFVDGLDRLIETKVDATVSTDPDSLARQDVMIVSGRVDRDGYGRTVKAYYPITEPKGPDNTALNPAFTATAFDSVQPTVTAYDAQDRVTKVTLPDDTASTMSFGFGTDRAGRTQFETIATDANGHATRTYTDVRGQQTAVKQFNASGGQNVIWTSFGYDALGQKASIQDDRNNSTSLSYDFFGRLRAVNSPDSGETVYVYDLAGNLTQKTTASRPTKPITYDYQFTRLTSITYPVFTGNNVTYTYGGPGAANRAAGRITHITDAAGSVDRQYGPLGEVTSETRTTTGAANKTVSFTTQYQYDTWNRLLKLTYPDGEVLSYFYNSGGQVFGASGIKVAAKGVMQPYSYAALTYDKFGQRVLQRSGNGDFTRYSYDSTNQRLTNIKSNQGVFVNNNGVITLTPGGYTFQNLNYTYDHVGNIAQIQNNTAAPTDPSVGAQVGGPSTQSFAYDDLNRLTHAEGSYAPAGKIDTYTQDLTYDSISNITNKADNHTIISNGQTSVDDKLTYNNSYAYATAGKPHAASTVGVFTFQYDAAGNQISREQQSGPRQQLIWDEENRLECDHENDSTSTLPQDPSSCDGSSRTPDAAFLYDDQGSRIVKKSANVHLYPNQFYSAVDKVEYKHIYIGDSHIVTQQRDDGKIENQQFWTHADHIGSTSVVTTAGFDLDQTSQLAQHTDYLPGGETWVNESPVQPVPLQYTGKELDTETGLYYYGARYYNPQFQQFQSPDPALPANATDSTSLSTYLYARGNPVNVTDPTGLAPQTKFAAPKTIRFSQDSVSNRFSDGGTIEDGVRGIQEGTSSVNDYPAIRVVERDGVLYTLDNRRLVTFQKAGVEKIPYRLATSQEAATEAWKFTTKTDGLSIRIRGTGETWSPEPELLEMDMNGGALAGAIQLLALAGQIFVNTYNRNTAREEADAAAFDHDLAGLQADYALIQHGLSPRNVTQWGPPNRWGYRNLEWSDKATYFPYVPFEDRFLPHPVLTPDGTIRNDFNIPANPLGELTGWEGVVPGL